MRALFIDLIECPSNFTSRTAIRSPSIRLRIQKPESSSFALLRLTWLVTLVTTPASAIVNMAGWYQDDARKALHLSSDRHRLHRIAQQIAHHPKRSGMRDFDEHRDVGGMPAR
jgi:hypothetical protein